MKERRGRLADERIPQKWRWIVTGRPVLLSLLHQLHNPFRPPRRRPKQQKKKSLRARRAQKPPLKGQSRFYSLEAPAPQASSPAEHSPRVSKTRPKVQILRHNEAFRNNWPSFLRLHTAPTPQSPIQRESARWHCAARREITERSEEAPGAEAAQPSQNVGCWKTPAGCFGGDARGAEKGAQPHNRPRLAARRAGGPNNRKRKASVPAGHRSHLSKDNPCFVFFRAPAAHPLASPRRRPRRAHKPLFNAQGPAERRGLVRCSV